MADESADARQIYEGLPVVGGLLRRQRKQVERVIMGILEAMMRDSGGLDAIVRRLDIDAIVARLDIDELVARLDMAEIVARLDIDAIVARLDLEAIVARLDIDALVARLDMNEVVAKLDFAKLADQIVDDVDLPKAIRQAGGSVVRGRRPRSGTPRTTS